MAHVNITEPWEVIGIPTPVPQERGVGPAKGGGLWDPFVTTTTVYVEDFLLARVQQVPSDQSTLISSASLASDHVRLFGPGEGRENPHTRT